MRMDPRLNLLEVEGVVLHVVTIQTNVDVDLHCAIETPRKERRRAPRERAGRTRRRAALRVHTPLSGSSP